MTCGGVCAAIGLAALAGWALRNPFLMGVRERYIPMAPNTALAFVVLGLGLIALFLGNGHSQRIRKGDAGRDVALPVKSYVQGWTRWLAGLGACLVALISRLRLFEFSTGKSFDVDSWFLQVPTEKFGLAPLGKMASFTAVGFFGGRFRWRYAPGPGKGRSLISWPASAQSSRERSVWSSAWATCSVPTLRSCTAARRFPWRLNTALAFVVLGAGLAAVGGPGSFPVRRLCGPSIRALAAGLLAADRGNGHLRCLADSCGLHVGRSELGRDQLRGTGHGRDFPLRCFPGADGGSGRRADRKGRGRAPAGP